jgi:predicted metalloprotease
VRWRRSSSDDQDVIDQRADGGGGMAGLPGGVRIGGGAGLIGVIITIAVLVLGGGSDGGGGVFGQVNDPFGAAVQSPSGSEIPRDQDPDRDLRDFSAYVFSSAQRTWQQAFAQQGGGGYDRAKLVLYSGGVNTACGSATSAAGPFYCPGDQRVYLDLSFYRDMADKLNAPGDFAWAYVIAHEVGHHVQRQLGTEQQVRELQQQNPGDRNALSVRLELQADCYAGVWAHKVQSDLEPGDADEALGAASAVGDDRLQRASTGTINPDSFTHGSSEQRVRWFRRGQESGEPAQCDTFSASEL